MKKYIGNLFIYILGSSLISALTIYFLWFINKELKDFGTIAMYLFYTSFAYILIGIISTIGFYSLKGDVDIAYQQAKTKVSQSSYETTKKNLFNKSKFHRLAIMMYIVGFILFIVSYITLSAYQPNIAEIKPETPVLTVNGETIPVSLRNFSIRKYGTSYSYGDELSTKEISKNISPTIVSSEANLNVKFTEKPKEIIIGYVKQRSGLDILREETYVLPKEKGKYIYELHAEWKDKEADYVFIIQVQE